MNSTIGLNMEEMNTVAYKKRSVTRIKHETHDILKSNNWVSAWGHGKNQQKHKSSDPDGRFKEKECFVQNLASALWITTEKVQESNITKIWYQQLNETKDS